MIRRGDFQIDICQSPTGASIHIRHRRTGKERIENGVPDSEVCRVRDRLLRELRGELYSENDFQVRIGRAESGDFVQVIHLPTGKSRLECPLGKKSQNLLTRNLMDSILEELSEEARREAREQ